MEVDLFLCKSDICYTIGKIRLEKMWIIVKK